MSSLKSVIIIVTIAGLLLQAASKPVKNNAVETPDGDNGQPKPENDAIENDKEVNPNEENNDPELVDNKDNPLLRPSGDKALDSKPEISSEEDSDEDWRPPASSEECDSCELRNSIFAVDVKKTYIEEKKP